MAKMGRAAWDPYRGHHVDFRAVKWPGFPKGRRIRINRAPTYGRFDSEAEAEKCRLEILAQCLDRELCDVLADYMKGDVPENAALHRWNHEFLPELHRRHQRGKLSQQRLRELGRYEARGHLDFWSEISIHAVDTAALYRWIDWLQDNFPKLGPRTIKHLVVDFGTFLRYAKRIGTIKLAPEIPEVEVPIHLPKVPEKADLGRLLSSIPWPIRGRWLAGSLAGLRPSEARRLDVADYAFGPGELTIPPEKSKTQRGRILPIRDVVPILDEWITEFRGGAHRLEPLFVNPNAKNAEGRWTDRPERRAWARALELCGFEHIRPNEGGRHAFATHEIGDGTDPFAVKDWMGHTSMKSTDRYKTVSAVTLARRMRPRRAAQRADERSEEPKR